MKKQFIKFCPHCGSTNISAFTGIGSNRGDRLNDYCKDCKFGLHSPGLFPETDNLKKAQKKIKQ